MPSAADTITAALEPVRRAYPDSRGVLQALTGALMAPVQIADDVARDGAQPAWWSIRDPDTCPPPFLPWLAQHIGVRLRPSGTVQEWREQLRRAGSYYRGTTRAIIEEVQATLIGSRSVRVLEHVGGNQWAQTVITRASETPDPMATIAAAGRQKPAFIVQTVITSDVPLIDQFTRTIDAITAPIDSITTADVT